MPSFAASSAPLVDADVDLVVVAATGEGADADPVPGPGAQEVADAIEVDLAEELSGLAFDGSVGASARIPTRGRLAAPIVLVVGVGPAEEVTADRIRRAAATAADAAERLTSVATSLHLVSEDAAAGAAAVVEGFGLASYRFDRFKTDATPHSVEEVALHGGEDVADAVSEAAQVVDAVIMARDLVNLPAADKRPPALAAQVIELLDGSPVEIDVLDEDALEDGGYGGLLGVGAGSDVPPRLVELRYRPDGAERHVTLVGKGITFDSGGLSLKSNTGMEKMKVDMAGAAAVLATVTAAAALEVPVAITGLLALAENMPSGTATRPGDVLRTRNGTTVEVLNTDAEGRLVLADALAHASESDPDEIIDLATLTGAAVVALGPKIGALMSDDDDLATALVAAGDRAGEPLWRLPLAHDQYGEDLKGDVGDVKNSGWKGAGTIRAGLFLREFVGEGIPWGHLDIAGVAWSDSAEGYLRAGGTGVPVRTLVEWLRHGS